MFRSTRRPRGLALLIGAGLLALAGVGVLIGTQTISALLTSSSLPAVLLVGGGFSLVAGYLSYRVSSIRLLSQLQVISLSDIRAPTIHASINRLTHRMRIDRPEVYIARLGQPTAFALGTETLVVDRSLIRLLTSTELEGVLAHELAHLEGYDSLLRTLAASLLRMVATLVLGIVLPAVAVVSLSCWGLSLVLGRPVRGPRSVGSRLRRGLRKVVMGVLIAPTVALQAYSRRREYAADRRAVAVLDDPLALARALEKIQRVNEPGRGLVSWLFPTRERKTDRTPLEQVFASHPPTDKRIRRVRDIVRDSETNNDLGQWRRIEIN
ncbi:M48 family metallopeptidase [Halocatena pleomorpha]|uniref:Peptidase M48 Ste24p n=1 Tax=Halocatena pleomorpha TaxID=1785090 RepID=A0A3P3RDR1_9EURY|nr:M48 family metalloprotease [Halocatena pleomorpha]RRJ31474.1 peptidase M48 Ste24p [Halocatena pleomorpha]